MIKVIEIEHGIKNDLITFNVDATQKLILCAQIHIYNRGSASPYFFTEAIKDVDFLVLILQYLLSINKLIKVIITWR